jgi:hypothetical protein
MDKKIYCGDYDLPPGYDKLGTRYRCMTKGFGIGTNLEKEAEKKGKT